MKKYLVSIILLFFINLVFAQDIIYTVSGELNENKTALDSILIENLTNSTFILFGNLPAQEYYQINLTKKVLEGTVGVNLVEDADAFVVSQNMPGKLIISHQKNIAIRANIAVYNINGQKVFASENKILNARNSVQVSLCNSGVFFVQIETPFGTQTFKAIGSANVKQYDIEISDEITFFAPFKSSQIINDSDFSFSPGDSIRISVFKNEYYARPIGRNIVDSDNVNFIFKVSTEKKLGISNAFVNMDKNTTDVTSYDKSNGEVRILFTGEKPKLLPGNIFVVDVDTIGYLRKVVGTMEENGFITVQTEHAFFNEVFVDLDVKLNTSFMNPVVQLNNENSLEEISAALTDENEYIHPVKIIYHDTIGNLIIQSAIGESDINDRINIIDYSHDLAVNLYGEEGDAVHFFIDEGYVSLVSDAVFEFDFDFEGEITEDTKVKVGDLKTYMFYFDSRAEFLAKLVLDMSTSYEIEKENKLIDLKNVRAKFIVGIVPVWITFNCDIYGNYHLTSDTALHANWGFESNNDIKIGGTYNKQAGSFSPINSYETNDTICPPNIEGKINSSVQLEIYPRVDVEFYDSFGSFAEIVPFVKSKYNSALQSQVTTGGLDTFLAWDSEINLGLDLRVGSELEFLEFNKEFDPTVINCFETLFWQSPTEITLQTTLPAEAVAGTKLSLIFKVVNSFDNPVKLCPVYITGDGTFSNEILFTDTIGEAAVEWTLSGIEGKNEFIATIYKADATIINEINDSVNIIVEETVPTVATYYATNKTINSATLNGNVISEGGAAITQRGFYWSKTDLVPDSSSNVVLVSGSTGQYEITISELELNTTYFYRAFATNSHGTSTGDVLFFITENEQNETGILTDSRDNITYETVKIGNQWWMAENLAYKASSGCWAYNNVESYVTIHGRLYTWDAAKTACPSAEGWHLPTDSEWEQLAQYISDDNGGYSKVEDDWNNVGSRLKTTSGWYNFGNGTDDYGFSGQPSGFRASSGTFGYIGFGVGWWSSTESSASDALGRGMAYNNGMFYRSSKGKIEGISIRCVKD